MLPITILLLALAGSTLIVSYLYFRLSSKNKKESSSLIHEVERKKYEASIILAIEDQIDDSLDIKKVGEVLIGSIEQVLEYDTSSYLILSPKNDKFIFKSVVKGQVSKSFTSDVKKRMVDSFSTILNKDFSKIPIDESFAGRLIDEESSITLGDFFNIPLVINNKLVGIFTVASQNKNFYDISQINLFFATTNRVLDVISRIETIISKERVSREKKEKEAERRAYQAEVLRELGERVGYSLDLAKIVEIISGSIGKLLEYSTISYMVQDKERIVFKCNIEESVSRIFVADIKTKMLEAFSAMLDKELNPDYVDESITGSVYNEDSKDPVSSFFNLPLIIDQKVVGLINVASPKNGLYTEEETSILYTITSQASTAVTKLTEVLEREKGKLNALVASLGDGIIMVDPAWNLLVVNTRARSMLSLPGGEISVLDVFDKLSGKIDVRTKIEEANATNDNIPPSEIKIENQILQVFTLRVRGKNQENFGAVISFHDITHEKEEKAVIERKVEERTRQLAEEQSRFIAAINSVPRGFIIVDTNKRIVVTNNILSKIFEVENNHEWTLSDLNNKLSKVYNIIGNYTLCLREKKSIKEVKVDLGSKTLKIFLAPISLEGSSENVIGVVILIDDITEATVMERSKDEFFSIASHELRTPLTAIKGNASLIEDYYADKIDDKEIIDMVSDIRDSSSRLIGIVNDFLDMSRLEQGKIEFKRTDFGFNEFIGDVFKDLKAIADEKKLYLKSEVSGPLPDVFADRDKAKQIFINLIGNALKFTSTGGVTVEASVYAKFLKVSVSDTGRGIPIENQRLLFRKFQQAGSSILTRDTTKGTGLGLYIAKLMVEGMGGYITLQKSAEGKGTTFVLLLPIILKKGINKAPIDGSIQDAAASAIQHAPQLQNGKSSTNLIVPIKDESINKNIEIQEDVQTSQNI